MALNSHQQELLRQLTQRRKPISDRDPRKWTAPAFALEHGWLYEPIATPTHLPAGTENECFANAFRLAVTDTRLIYCEGYALHKAFGLMVHHAWVTDGKGHAIDSTWPSVGVAYAGIPFRMEFLDSRLAEYEAIICVLDDYMHGWPLLVAGAEGPEQWLEQRGRGTRRISDEVI